MSEKKPLNLPFSIGAVRPLFAKDNEECHLRLWQIEDSSEVQGSVVFDASMQGPPGYAHGGLQAFVLDESMGAAGWHNKYSVVAEHIEVDFLQMAPIGKVIDISAWVLAVGDRTVLLMAELKWNDQLIAQSKGRFHVLSEEQLKLHLKSVQ